MLKKIFFISLLGFLIIVPGHFVAALDTPDAYGQSTFFPSCSPLNTFAQLVSCSIQMIISPLVTVLIGLALLAFFWGLFNYLRHLDNETERAKGSSLMFYGVIALFVMVSVWGLVKLLSGIFAFDNTMPPIPSFPGSSTSYPSDHVV